MFIRQKPPVQYTMILLTQNVFSALQHPLSVDKREYELDLNIIYKKANELFPPWWENDVKTIQVKRSWIKEDLDTLVMIRLIKYIPENDSYFIPIPTLPIRKQADITICKKIAVAQKKAIRHRGLHYIPKVTQKKRPSGTKSLKDYL